MSRKRRQTRDGIRPRPRGLMALLRSWFTRWTSRAPSVGLELDAHERRRRRALRQVWEIGDEFGADGWGGRDFLALRLLCLNLRAGQTLGSRLAERLRAAIPPVLGPGCERLRALAVMARELPVDPETIERLDRALEGLKRSLHGVACRPGEPLPFDPVELLDAVDDALQVGQALRTDLAPLVTADLAATVQQIAKTAHAARLETGELMLELGAGPLPPVAVEPSDLAEAIGGLLATSLSTGRRNVPVRITVHRSDDALQWTIAWLSPQRRATEPWRLVRPLRALAAYGVEHALQTDSESGGLELCAWFPLVERIDGGAASAAGFRPPTR